jgi:hypothetical protein
MAGLSAARKRAYRQPAEDLTLLHRQAGQDIVALNTLAQTANSWFFSTAFAPEFPQRLRGPARVEYLELKARDGVHRTFSTVAGPRQSVIEATAIWGAKEFLKTNEPCFSLAGCKVVANRLSWFQFKVRFTDPKSGQSHEVFTSFGDSSVLDYLAKNP